ncbi:MAG: AAA family ATPase, partial [Desulfovibrio sp.]|nr:AAA family ATPase [Desulfovibrio sp.]
TERAPQIKEKIPFQLRYPSKFPKNRIIFGAPGTGKSHKLKHDSEPYFGPNIERVTFHPDYAYSHFMGCYKPQTTREGNIRYGFVPGPFLRVLVRALRSGMEGNPQPHLLLIEEINRARVAAVFGDAFQLLDRADGGYSEYDIAVSEDVKEYLSRELGCAPEECGRIRIPGNMFIWATMNSADQGVFPMDTAFKRRWSFEYLPIDPANPPDVLLPMNIGRNRVTLSWNALRGAINDSLSSLRINEDKLIGPYFLKPSVLEGDTNGIIKNIEGFNDVFKNKILMYLFEDAARQRRPELFKGCVDHHRYSSLCKEYEERGLAIFGEDFVKTFSKDLS